MIISKRSEVLEDENIFFKEIVNIKQIITYTY